MPITYRIDVDRRLVLTTAEGVVTDEDVLGLKARLLADPLFDPGLRELSDARGVTDLRVTPDGVAAFAGFDREHGTGSTGYRLALVASEDLVYGMARMYEGFATADTDHVGVFRTMEEATAWLGGA